MAAMSVCGMVEVVRRTFALNVDQTASVFHVSRATIYRWASPDTAVVEESNDAIKRMVALVAAAHMWSEREHLLGRWQTERLPSGATVIDLLSADLVSLAALAEAHDVLLPRNEARRTLENQLARHAVAALRPAFATMGAAQEARRHGCATGHRFRG